MIFLDVPICFSQFYLQDDTSVFIEGTHFDNITHILNLELEKVNTWLKANKLTVNL